MALPFIVIVTIAIGSADAQIRGMEPQLNAEVFLVKAKLTAYDACMKCCGQVNGKTAMGVDGRKPTGVAAANTLVPLGSYVWIDGLPENEIRLVDDTGGGMRKMARKGYLQFDIRFGGKNAHRRALHFGTQWREVYVYIKNPTAAQRAFFNKTALFAWTAETLDPEEAFAGAAEQFAFVTASS